MKIEDGDQAEYAKIANMSIYELFDYVLASPHLLTDSYYKGFDTAIYNRAEQLGVKPRIRIKMGRKVI